MKMTAATAHRYDILRNMTTVIPFRKNGSKSATRISPYNPCGPEDERMRSNGLLGNVR